MSDPVNVFEEIQSICREFRRQSRQGEPARIEDCLERLDEEAREVLFQNVLHLDIEFQRRQSEGPSSDEYIQRFPQFAKLIRQAFFESTMMSRDLPFEESWRAIKTRRLVMEYSLRSVPWFCAISRLSSQRGFIIHSTFRKLRFFFRGSKRCESAAEFTLWRITFAALELLLEPQTTKHMPQQLLRDIHVRSDTASSHRLG